MISVTIDTRALQQQLDALGDNQLPFATAKALNDVALAFQQREREELQRSFTIRRPWVLQGVKINRGDFATKEKLDVTVQIDPQRDFLNKFEQGDPKRARDGGSVVIPEQVRRTKADVVAKSMRPRALGFVREGSGPKGTVFVGKNRTFMIRRGNDVLILQRTGRGVRGPRQRHAGTGRFVAGARRPTTDTKLLFYGVRHAVRTPRRLSFLDNARVTMERVFPLAFRMRLEEARATAR